MKDKDLLEIKDKIYPIGIYIDKDNFEGKISDIKKFIDNLPKNLVEKYGVSDRYYEFELDWDISYEGSIDIEIYGYRKETIEEANKRLLDIKKRSEASKKAVITKKEAQIKREKTLLETLKKKYE